MQTNQVVLFFSYHSLGTASWKRWSEFHYQLDFCPGVQPCLRLTACSGLQTIPASLFSWDEEKTILSLPSYYQELLVWLKYNKVVRIMIEGDLESEAQQLCIINNVLLSSQIDC